MYINFQCPHCGHKNGMTTFETVKTTAVVHCDSEEGGCDQPFVIEVKFSYTVETFTLTPATYQPVQTSPEEYVWLYDTGERAKVLEHSGNTVHICVIRDADTPYQYEHYEWINEYQYVPDEHIYVGAEVTDMTTKNQGYVDEITTEHSGERFYKIDLGSSFPKKWLPRHHIRLQ